LPIPRLPAWSTCFLQELLVETWTITAEAFHTSLDKVCDALERVVTFRLEHPTD
jgi:hypothetical protein